MSENIEYEALNFDGLERRGNYRLIAFREDMLYALDKKDAAAIVFQIVFRWQREYKREEVIKKIEARKRSGQKPYTQEEVEEMMFVYMSYNDFVRESGGAVGYNTVIRIIDYLIAKKALIQKKNHDPKFADYEYSVNRDVVREMLKALPVQPPFAPKIPKKKGNSTQMGTPEDESTQVGTDSTQTGIPSTQMGTEVYPNGGTSQELTGNTHNHTEEESIPDQSQTANSSPNGDMLSLLEEMKKRLEAVEQDNQSLRAELSTAREQLSTPVEKPNNQTGAEANNETSYSRTATQPTPSSEPAQPASNKGTGRRTKKDATQDLTLQGAHIIEMYEAFKKRKITRNPGNVKAANGLGESVASDTDFNEVLTVIANDAYLKKNDVRVDLDFVYRKYDGFFDVVVRLREKGQSSKSGQSSAPAITQVTDPYVLATMRSAQRTLAAVN